MQKYILLRGFLFFLSILGAMGVVKALTDVPEAQKEAIRFVQEQGYMTGYTDDTFRPEKAITRAEMAALLTRNEPECRHNISLVFQDLVLGDWTHEALCRAMKRELFKGDGDQNMRPYATVNAAEAFSVLQRHFSPSYVSPPDCLEWWCAGLHFLAEKNAIPLRIKTLNGDISRGEMAMMLFWLENTEKAAASKEKSLVQAREALYPENKIMVDSHVTFDDAMKGINPQTPPEIIARQVLLDVFYVGFDDKRHFGQILVDERLAEDVQAFFALAEEISFPIEKVMPASAYNWDDDALMAANVTSGFNYRFATDLDWVSHHGYGFAIDVNPRINPYFGRNNQKYPPNGHYAPGNPGVLTAKHPLVTFMGQRGWSWGGFWSYPRDYHHFQKLLY